uniref:MAGE domain-containing protein n=1 Tax=Aegilops tauschii subsp. strangulata TaxID=200361 RepID=A0A453BMR8_AEGTS
FPKKKGAGAGASPLPPSARFSFPPCLPRAALPRKQTAYCDPRVLLLRPKSPQSLPLSSPSYSSWIAWRPATNSPRSTSPRRYATPCSSPFPSSTSARKVFDVFIRPNRALQEKDKLVAEVMRYALFKTHQNSGCPIKREELTQIITKNYRQRALPALVIKEAGDRLAATFGYEMRELQRTRATSTRSGRPSSQQPSNQDAKSYVLVSKLDPEVYSKYVEDTERAHVSGFAFVVISIVHVAGGKISEEDLWRQLKRLGLNETDENHPVLGNNKQALELLVQQRYLLKEKIAGPEGHSMVYELAERALDESISSKLKEYISQVVGVSTATAE